MASYSYTYYSDTKSHGSYSATMEVSCGHYTTTTNDTVTISMEGAAHYKSANATGYGVHVQVGHDAVGSYSKRYANGYGVLNYGNWIGSASGSWSFSRGHSAYNVWIWSAAWGETVSGYGAAPESAGGGKTITIPARPSYSVTFNANGGSGAPSTQTKWYNESLALSSTTPTRTGYTFNGWNTKSDGSGTNYAAGASYTGNAALTLYAKWTAVTYAISYNGNGSTSGSTSAQTKTYGVALTLRSNGYTRTNYVFKNWNTAANGSGTAYSAGASYTANATATMYAQWYAPYTITPDPNGGTLASGCSALTKVYNTAKTIWAASLNPTRAGYNFNGWNTTAAGTGTNYAAGSSYTANANATLYAQWEIAHSNPTISNLLVQRCLQDGTLSDDGEYCKVSATVSVDHSTTGYTDTKLKTVTVQVGSNAAESVTVSTTATSASISFVSANQVSLTSTYSVKLTVTDSHDFSSYRTSNISVAYFTMHFKEGGKGIAIGKKSVTDNLFDVNMNTNIAGTLDTTGKITSLGNVQAQCYLILRANADNFSAIRTIPKAGATGRSGDAIRFYGVEGNSDGDEIVIGNGGHVIVGAGESGPNLKTALGVAAGNKTLELASDGVVNIYTTCNTIANRLRWQFNASSNAPYVYADCGAASAVAVDTSTTNGVTANTNLGGYYIRDKNAYWTGFFGSRTGTSGDIWTMIAAHNKKEDGSDAYNYIQAIVTKAGAQTYSVSNPTNFRSAIAAANKPTQLYNNTTGSTGTITLAYTAANYNHMRIYYRSNDSEYSSVDVFTPNGKKVDLLQATPNSGGNTYLKLRSVTISGTSIATSANTEATIYNGASSQASSSSKATIYIVRVEGWNE